MASRSNTAPDPVILTTLMTHWRKIIFIATWFAAAGTFGAVLVATSAYLYLAPKLPSAESYRHLRLENPLRIFSADGRLIAEFGDKKRDPVKYEDVPPLLISALVASEDSRFYSHNGVDPRALARSVVGIITGNPSGGGSTLTMQVAKNISFAGEDAYSRKFKEILLALQIERELSKEQILELYLNQIFFGISAYGISAATTQYYNKPPQELSLAEMAMLVAILPAPNSYNPLRSPERAQSLRSRVLRRMHEQGMITQAQYREANSSPITASRYGRDTELRAPYIAELVRQEMIDRYGDRAMTDGFEVYTTIDSRMQASATTALEQGLEAYDRQHGYRGPENHFAPQGDNPELRWLQILAPMPAIADQHPAFVQALTDRTITALMKDGQTLEIPWEGIRWAKRYINVNAWGSSPRTAQEVVSVGDLIRVTPGPDGSWQLGQLPAVNGAVVALDPDNGGIKAMVGGYDFTFSKFNRVTQARRQPGSNFKPFLYSAALENGYTAASLINDAPLPRSDYRPENFNREFLGPIRLKYALTNSKNLVSLRLYDALGEDVVLPYVERFGFNTRSFPSNDLTVAIGSHAVTPLEIATGYAVFANGGYKVEPHFIERIENFNDGVVFQAEPLTVCQDCEKLAADAAHELLNPGPLPNEMPVDEAGELLSTNLLAEEVTADEEPELRPAPRVIDERNAYIMNAILQSVITEGSGRPASRAMARRDLAGKTGTTNDAMDLWFSGYNGDLVATVFVGFDQPESLGRSEQAATVALPIWIDFMKDALEGRPEHVMAQPDGLVTLRINEKTGLRARADEPGAIFEVFRVEEIPEYGNGDDDSNVMQILGEEAGDPGRIF